MSSSHYLVFILVGFVLVLLGAGIPLMMVLGTLESTFLLNFLAYGAQIGGLFLGFIGASLYVRESRSRRDRD